MAHIDLTTGDIGEICGVSPKTAAKWIDNRELKGYRLGPKETPSSRRVTAESLREFMLKKGMSTVSLDEFLGTSTTILVVGQEIGEPNESEGLRVVRCESLYQAVFRWRYKTDVVLVWWALVEQNREFLDFARTQKLRIFAVRPDGVDFRHEAIEEYLTLEVARVLAPAFAKRDK